jgi:Palmitoyl protein thioesterase
MRKYSNFLRSRLDDDVYVKTVTLINDPNKDLVKGLTVHPFDQIKQVCGQIQMDPKFQKGYNAIGLSQGGLFL